MTARPREYVAEALDLWICAPCRRGHAGPPACGHSDPIRVDTAADLATWWRLRLLARPSAEVSAILHVTYARIRAGVTTGRSVPGRLGVVWGRAAGG